jgi:hypothetical protein
LLYTLAGRGEHARILATYPVEKLRMHRLIDLLTNGDGARVRVGI